MDRILCSTGACIGRPNGRDFRLLADCVRNVDCGGWEFMMYDSWYGREEEISLFLRSLPACFPVMHCEKGVGELLSRSEPGDAEEAFRLFALNCRMAASIGARLMVLHLWNGVHSDKNISHNIRAFERLRALAERHGLLLTVENVVCSHADPLTHMRTLAAAYPDIRFTFDTKMAHFHGQLSDLLAPENRWLWSHIAHLHVNDHAGAPMDWNSLRTLHIGLGEIDFAPLFAHLRDISYPGCYTVEATSFDSAGAIHFEELNETVRRLRALITAASAC